MATIMELVLLVDSPNTYLYFHKDTGSFDYSPFSKNELDDMRKHPDEPATVSTNSFRFLTFKELDHRSGMSLFVKEFVTEDKKLRKELFDILRPRETYVRPFIAKLKEHDLYDDYEDFNYDYYKYHFDKWAEEHGLKF